MPISTRYGGEAPPVNSRHQTENYLSGRGLGG